MEPQTQILILKITTVVFILLWAWAALLYNRESRRAVIQRELMLTMGRAFEAIKLAEMLLTQNKVNQDTTKELVDCLKTLNDRTSAYNERLNNLTTAVRTKVSRIDNNGVNM